MTARPARVLVTGFGPFPGAPVNPTQWLIKKLREEPLSQSGAFRVGLLDVDYATIADQLAVLAKGFWPDIAIHFGLAASCRGFRLEKIARNSHAGARPDRAGRMPAALQICKGPDSLASTLPLGAIAERLSAAGLPVEWSNDAGGYLCNNVMTLSLAHAVPDLCPALAGFIHVPSFPDDAALGQTGMKGEQLAEGARLIVATCADEWRAATRQ